MNISLHNDTTLMIMNRYRRTLILIIASQLLLILFVLYWIRSQYMLEKEELSKELFTTYIETQDDLIDTVLFRDFVRPVLRTAHYETERDDTRDSMISGTVIIEHTDTSSGNFSWKGRNNSITVRIGSISDSVPLMPDTLRIRRSSNDLILRSLKLVVAHSSDSGSLPNPALQELNICADTTQFLSKFNENISGKGMNFSVAFNKVESGSGNIKSSKSIRVDPSNPFSLPGLQIEKYRAYLFRQITPQILFGMFLICITALAFSLSVRNIKKQIILNDIREEFISNISHELKTPVSTIRAALEFLEKYDMAGDPGKTKEYIALASGESRRLELLVTRVLDNSLSDTAPGLAQKKKTDIALLAGEILQLTRSRYGEDLNIELSKKCEDCSLMCDELLFKGVLINLVENSIKYCDKVPEIVMSLERKNDEMLISVSDNGPGIEEEYQKLIFEKFFRVPSGNVHNVKGYGLGLSYVKNVVGLHSGTVTVSNNKNGCTFTIRIPVS